MQALINRLKHYNAWRRGAEIEMPAPAQLGKDIDAAIEILEEKNERTNRVRNPK